ncbi:hypothetical protein KJ652_02915 [Patescibacteria group bacterium]|nr:hypothetical protein [Patescibacteria group bacterium]MBU1123518.1 hypothetical protein [Patescibacteria group bacterium]MBU1910927.1 hypothetical protein [Patescibacteria group bacterium]
MSHYLDLLPSNEKAKIRAKLRSPEAYERLREKVKGPEDLERELKVSESYANLSFSLKTEPKIKEELKKQIQEDIDANGIEEVLEQSEAQRKIDIFRFNISVEENPESHQDQIVVSPEGNVGEKIPIKPSFTEKYLSSFG